MTNATHCLRDGGKAGALCVGPGLSVAGDTGEHDAGVDGGHLLVPEVPSLERPGPEVLGHDVGLLDEP